MIEPAKHRPIQVTEVDERVYDDCGPCSFLMLAQAWTLGDVVHRPDGREMSKPELKRLREKRWIHLPASAQTGGTTLDVPGEGVALLDLPAPTSDWPSIRAKLADGWSGVVNGNPKDCPPDSALRR